ncbi:SDR family NAD(P)-dependent oxidoreductase [Actinacidiphila oryziradicis]|uniref:SDR family NAD(P)-dependent oxidoreductase n=1 Tax=Actinacidiphila oryziradicis TaxID=2571141 RepID=A0A4U0RZM4_9ACTN|nr:SDR family NAD(P)-dependent oxidoreductase [Actinacidiphila oryziradicis]TKA01208.1 SDR family NAD(P)-dependent oxidoreductase [Actinacidiphila oryziradicis]
MSSSALPSVPTRTALVTGATSGIGWETARLLAEQGCTVIVHAPDTESGHHAVERLVAAGADRARLRLAVADFARLDDVRALASMVGAAHPVLDVLVNNAAVAAPERHTLTADGHELSFQVNFLAAYLLTRALAGPLTARPGSRVVNVSSAMHRTASISWNDLNRARHYSRHAAYAQSQLALTVFARAEAPTGCTAVSVHPGICETTLLPLYAHEGEPAAEGAARVVRLCDPATELVPGGYYDRTALSPAAPVATEDRTVRRLCKLADQLVAA